MATLRGSYSGPETAPRLAAFWDWIRPMRHLAARTVGRGISLNPAFALRLIDPMTRGALRAGVAWVATRLYGNIPGSATDREEVLVRWVKSHLVRTVVEAGGAECLKSMACWANVQLLSEALSAGRPIILIYPYSDLMSLLHSRAYELGVPVAVIRNEAPTRQPSSVRFAARPEPTSEGRALMLLKARAQLRAGGAVMVALHAHRELAGKEAVIQGRRVTFPMGIFTLARLTGALVFPVVPRWVSATEVEFSVHEPLPAEPSETAPDLALMRQAGAWLDRHLSLAPLDRTFATHLWVSRSPPASLPSSP